MQLPNLVARELAWCSPGREHEGYTVVENRDHDERRWEMVMELVVSDGDGKLYRTFYRRGLTEYQESRPFEYEGDLINFQPVLRKVVESYAYEGVGEVV